MPGEVITIQAGQCGNQIGQEFWKQLCKEHSIDTDGCSQLETRNDYPDLFFRQDNDTRFTPRAILIDLEPRVVNNISAKFGNLFNPRNVYASPGGLGAGNNWSQGWDYAMSHMDELTDLLDREADSCDNLEAFQLIHSVAGGTGSGLGSWVLERLRDRYGKKLVQTYSVFPASNQPSDVVVQPYNTMLTLKRLIELSDSTVVLDNGALHSIAVANSRHKDISLLQTNQLVSAVIASMTNPLRFPTAMYNSFASVLAPLVPIPQFHFLVPSFYPFTSEFIDAPKEIRRCTSYDVILELMSRSLAMVSTESSKNMAIMHILQGNINHNDVTKGILRLQQRFEFVPWANSASVNLIYAQKSPYLNSDPDIVNGLMLANTTGLAGFLRKVCNPYDKLIKRNAFLDGYSKGALFKDGLDEFYDSREKVQGLMDDYAAAEKEDFV